MKMRFLIPAVALALACAPLIVINADAKSRGGSSFGGGSRSFSSHSPGSGSWGRSAPSHSITSTSTSTRAAPSSGNVAKPSLSTQTQRPASSGNVVKPTLTSAPAAAQSASSGNVAKPSLSTQTQRPASSGNVVKPSLSAQGATAAKALPPAPQQRTQLDRAASAKASAESLSKMRAEQAKFKAPAAPVTAQAVRSNSIASSYTPDRTRYTTVNHYYVERDRFYSGLGYSRPIYVGYGAPYYGVYNSDYLAWAMLYDQAFFYHHAADPGVIAWQRDYRRIAQEKNDLELQLALAKIDAEKAKMTGPANNKYVPEKMKPEMMLTDSLATGVAMPELSFATNEEGTIMATVCNRFKAHAEDTIKVNCLHTAGSYENLEKLSHGKVDAALAQADVIDYMQREGIIKQLGKIQETAYHETMWLLVNRDSGLKSVSDLKPGVHTVLVGPQGSGTEFSFRNLKKHAAKAEKRSSWVFFTKTVDVRNEQYEGVGVKNASYKDGFTLVADNKNTTMLVLTGGNSSVLAKVDAEYGDKVRLIPISGDPSFAKIEDKDGNPVYGECAMPTGNYPKLFDGKTTQKTLCVQEVLVFSPAWSKKSGQAAEAAEDSAFTAWKSTKLDLEQLNGGVR